ncbi:hypothetical protein E1286_27645 [Nonomuraea terrae]|uniref:Uncharacterized protein n=1 Tax=Nonomuraea terrae TaxID=2530383 RepID=A0A4V6PDS2_9ACTN|nr:hypothetical protein [Nonomuraea terrae]TDD44207.1 hypothetical protein E1286_27645 [Nonomuraea terrae]
MRKLSEWWKKRRDRRRMQKAVEDMPSKGVLREFVYLDEVSLRSLLVSQSDTIPEQVSRSIALAEQAEITGKLSGGNTAVAKAEIGSKFQTSNSNTVQTSRKAVVQTLFKELRDQSRLDYALVVRTEKPEVLTSAEAIRAVSEPSTAVPASSFVRGALVEIEVELEVDPIFKLGTLFTEYSEMVEEFPRMMDRSDRSTLNEFQPVRKVLERFLTGLIPIRAKAVNYSVVTVSGQEYVVHNSAIAGLGLTPLPLEVVGVTEHLGYWKDIRRVLFSSGRFTILCRVSRDGIQRKWTPVKLADLFRDVAPTLVDQISASSRAGILGLRQSRTGDSEQQALVRALTIYQEKLSLAASVELDSARQVELAAAIVDAGTGEISAVAQKSAFTRVREIIQCAANNNSIVDAETDLSLRQEARSEGGLTVFSTLASPSRESQPSVGDDNQERDRLLDVEVVAIYW